MPSKTVILLEKRGEPGNNWSLTYVLWADVPGERRFAYANPTFESKYKDVTAAELNDLRSGRVAEKHDAAGFAAGTVIAAVKAYLENQWQVYQNEINGLQNWAYYGTHRLPDGTWVMGGF